MQIIDFNCIRRLNLSYTNYYEWIDYVLKNKKMFNQPEKTRILLSGSDYCNVMPCTMKNERYYGLKVINRSYLRRNNGMTNMDSQILLYDYVSSDLLAIMDGNYITTMRTAAAAVHAINYCSNQKSVISMIGLGNIGISIGDILFELYKDRKFTIKLYKYKNHAERFIDRFREYDNITFKICDNYDELMFDADVVISAVSYVENDFCSPGIYKKGCTLIPVHLRGFIECDKCFDNLIVSDLDRVKEFKYCDEIKKITYMDDVVYGKSVCRENDEERVIVYNFGLAMTDIYFASKIYELVEEDYSISIKPTSNFYV